MRLALFVWSWLLVSPGAFAQAPETPTLHTGAQIVVVDVTVLDQHGDPVHHLKPTNFTLLENGTPQAVSQFEEHMATDAARVAAAPALGPGTYTNFPFAPEDSASNILLFDTLNTPESDQAMARQKLIAFVKAARPGTRLAVFTLSTRLTLLQGFTSDSALLLAAVSKSTKVQSSPVLPESIGAEESLSSTVRIPSAEIKGTMRQGEAMQTTAQNRLRVLTTLRAMNQLARYLSGIPGRKNLVWLSGSFPLNVLPNAGLKNGFGATDSFESEMHETANLFARSQVAIYPVDLHGLQNSALSDASSGKYVFGSLSVQSDVDAFSNQKLDEQGTMRQLAESTGGKAYVNTNDLKDSIGKALDNGANYYTLIYSPTDKEKTGYRRIEVRLPAGNYSLSYRRGYYVDDPASKRGVASNADKKALPPPDPMHVAMQYGAPPPSQILFKALVVADARSSDKLAEGNIVASKSKPPYRLVTIAYAANPGDITMPAREDGTRHVDLEFVALVYDRDGKLFIQQSNRINVFARPEAVRDFLREGVRYQQQIAVPAKGEYYVRSGIHDLIGDKIGAIEIPASSIASAPSPSGQMSAK
jgi:VWFA-related protein